MVAVPKPPADPPNCEKCGLPTTLLIVIQRFGDEPGYRLFHCETEGLSTFLIRCCGRVDVAFWHLAAHSGGSL